MDEKTIALQFIRNVALKDTKRPNDIWSTIYHVAQDALDGHIMTLHDLGFRTTIEEINANS